MQFLELGVNYACLISQDVSVFSLFFVDSCHFHDLECQHVYLCNNFEVLVLRFNITNFSQTSFLSWYWLPFFLDLVLSIRRNLIIDLQLLFFLIVTWYSCCKFCVYLHGTNKCLHVAIFEMNLGTFLEVPVVRNDQLDLSCFVNYSPDLFVMQWLDATYELYVISCTLSSISNALFDSVSWLILRRGRGLSS